MRTLLFLLFTLLALGCSKREAPQPSNASSDMQDFFVSMKRERIYLLAIKYGLPPEKAESATWEYLKKHDLAVRMMFDQTSPQKGDKPIDLLRFEDDTAKAIPETVRTLSAQYGFPESAFAGLLADLKAQEASEK